MIICIKLLSISEHFRTPVLPSSVLRQICKAGRAVVSMLAQSNPQERHFFFCQRNEYRRDFPNQPILHRIVKPEVKLSDYFGACRYKKPVVKEQMFALCCASVHQMNSSLKETPFRCTPTGSQLPSPEWAGRRPRRSLCVLRLF